MRQPRGPPRKLETFESRKEGATNTRTRVITNKIIAHFNRRDGPRRRSVTLIRSTVLLVKDRVIRQVDGSGLTA